MAHTTERIDTADASQEPSFQRISANLRWLESVGWRIDSEVRHHEKIVAAIAIAVVTLFSLLFAGRKPFDVDEYLVRITDLAGSPGAIWRILKTAPLSVDPPLYHFLVHYCLRIFGPSEFGARLPSVAAYSVMSIFLYRFVRRYTELYTGLLVVSLCLLCGAFPFSYYARPYGLVLAADAAALFCWAGIVEGQARRALGLVGLFLGITISVGSHWFGFLVLLPLAIAEAGRTWQRGKIDGPVWATLVAASATALAYLPLLKGAVAYRALPWKGVALGDISDSFELILVPCLVPLLFLLILGFARLMLSRPQDVARAVIPASIFICLFAFALTPVAGFVLAKFVTHAFQPRYTLLCGIGVLPLVALAVRHAMAGRTPWMACAVFILGGSTLFLQYHSLTGIPAGGDTRALADVAVFSANGSLPVVAGGDGLFLRIEAHAPASLRQRCVFPTDPDFIRLLHSNTTFLMTEGLRRWTNLPIPDLSSFLNAHPQFYFIQIAGQDWVIRGLKDHSEITLQGTYAGNPVYLVSVHP